MRYLIKEARTKAGMSQKQLAEKMGIHAATLSGYEAGAHDPKSDGLVKIADICGVTVDFLLGREQNTSVSENTEAPNRIDAMKLYRLLVDAGYVEEGEDLTTEDLRFLMSVGDLISGWFTDRQ